MKFFSREKDGNGNSLNSTLEDCEDSEDYRDREDCGDREDYGDREDCGDIPQQ